MWSSHPGRTLARRALCIIQHQGRASCRWIVSLGTKSDKCGSTTSLALTWRGAAAAAAALILRVVFLMSYIKFEKVTQRWCKAKQRCKMLVWIPAWLGLEALQRADRAGRPAILHTWTFTWRKQRRPSRSQREPTGGDVKGRSEWRRALAVYNFFSCARLEWLLLGCIRTGGVTSMFPSGISRTKRCRGAAVPRASSYINKCINRRVSVLRRKERTSYKDGILFLILLLPQCFIHCIPQSGTQCEPRTPWPWKPP